MTLAVTVYVPTGIVMAADSRMILTAQETLPDGKLVVRQKVASDSSRHLVALDQPPVGVAIVGHHFVGGRPVDQLVERFAAERLDRVSSPAELAELLAAEFDEQFPVTSPTGFFVSSPTDVAKALAASFSGSAPRVVSDVGFYVAGYRGPAGEREPYVAYVGSNPRQVKRLNLRPDSQDVIYGAAWAGDREVVDRLLKNAPLVPFEFMSTYDAIQFATDMIEITARIQRWRPTVETVGGSIDVLLVTPEGVQWVQRKRWIPDKSSSQELKPGPALPPGEAPGG
ncbi:MAG TPA: hypothetical protein VER55_05060 [Ardenticatenaceae bacterium]|nr:hypothetical protein [Ardenticatenaceae bacterium]